MFHRLNITSPLFNLYCPGGDEGYFTGMMLKKTRVKLLESEIVTYPTTQMMRNLLVAQVCTVRTHSLSCVYCSSIFLWMKRSWLLALIKCDRNVAVVRKTSTCLLANVICLPQLVSQVDFRGQKLCLMTSHLESCKGHAEERMKQLRVVMQRMRDAAEDVTVLFGGDTNLRDTEVRPLIIVL